MRKLLFTAIHPAPYIDSWIEGLKKTFSVSIAYNYKKSAAKTWKTYKPNAGIIIKEYGLINWTRLIAKNDVIILNGWNKLYNIYTLFIALLLKKKIAVFSDYPIETRKSSFKWLSKKIFLSLLVPRILCATHSTQKYYQEIFAYKEKNTLFFPYATKEAPISNDFNLKRIKSIKEGDNIRFFVANNFRERKGYDVLTKALTLLDKDLLKQVAFIIAGSGELQKEFSSKIQKILPNVKFLGWIEEKEYSKLLQESDVLIHASTFEPFGIPPIDAMKHGKLIISSNGVKSISDMVVNGKNGFMFHAGNSVELAQLLTQTINLKEKIYKIGQRGKYDICKAYNNSFLNDLNL